MKFSKLFCPRSRKARVRRSRALMVETLETRALLAVTFRFNYQGAIGYGIGFEDATNGQARRGALQLAGDRLGRIFDHTATISVDDAQSADAFDVLSDTVITVLTAESDNANILIGDTFAVVSESGTTDTFTVVLNTQPVTDVVLAVTSADTDEVTVDTASLTFTNAIWNAPQTVTVTGPVGQSGWTHDPEYLRTHIDRNQRHGPDRSS